MKANELMIGDWVTNKTLTHFEKIDEDFFVGILTRKYEISEILPIPLTPEILEKNGWDVEDACYANYKLPDEFSSLEFYFHESSLRKWWEGVDEWDNHNKVRDITFQCHCTYVHELQHALRLCGLAELADNLKI